jgi:hypothetical protein
LLTLIDGVLGQQSVICHIEFVDFIVKFHLR